MARGGARPGAGRPRIRDAATTAKATRVKPAPEPKIVHPNTAAALAEHAWQPGQSGNPAGRKKGSRNVLAQDFIDALQADFAKNGVSTIETVRKERPQDYLKIIVAVLPKEFTVKRDDLEDMTDDELARAIAAVQNFIDRHPETLAGDSGTQTQH